MSEKNEKITNKKLHFPIYVSQMVRTICTFLAICGFVESCESEQPFPIIKDRTLIIYICSNNNLESQGKILISEIKDYVKKEDTDLFNLVVLYRDKHKATLLSNENRQLLQRKEYGDVNSLSKQMMSDILADIIQSFPAKEIGIIFWSHGTGWLPTGNNTTRSFGDDNGESIDIYDIAASFNIKFDYIIFDACYMSGIEVATELRNKSTFFMASPTTLPSIGIVDTNSLGFLLRDCPLYERLMNLCNYINEAKDIRISLIDLGYLDSFIDAVKLLQISHSCFPIHDIVKYEFRCNEVFFDLFALLKIINDKNVLSSFDNVLLFPKDLEETCNISVFIPAENNSAYWNNYSKTLWNIQTDWLSKWCD